MVRDLSKIRMNMQSYVALGKATELAIRQNELYEAMQIVEKCGCSIELTEVVTRLGNRLRDVQAEMTAAVQEATSWEWDK